MRAAQPLQPAVAAVDAALTPRPRRPGRRWKPVGFANNDSAGIGRLGAALGDPDHCRPQQAVVQHITGLQHLDDRAAGLARPLSLEDRLMKIVVEALALRIDALDAVPLEGAQQLAFGRRDPGQKTPRALIPGLR